MKTAANLFALVLLFAHSLTAKAQEVHAAPGQCLAYVGTYTGKAGKGIYLYQMDLQTGAFSPLGPVAETPNPAFFDLDSQGHYLFAANEINTYQGKAAGEISAFAIEPGTGKLTPLNQRSSMGPGPCHIVVDHDCKNALIANYAGGSIAVLPISSDGTLSEASTFIQFEGSSVNKARQGEPHAHCMTLDASGRFAFVCDLGTDKIMQYRLDGEHGKLIPNETPFLTLKPGVGPRHLTFAPNGHFAYLINEIGNSVTALAYDSEHGTLRELQTLSTLPDDFTNRNTCAEIVVHPSGKFVYGSNRGHNSIAVFAINPAYGMLTFVERQSTGGKTPRYFTIAPGGKFLVAANQDSNNLTIFAIDPDTGRLTSAGQVTDIHAPVCVKFLAVAAK